MKKMKRFVKLTLYALSFMLLMLPLYGADTAGCISDVWGMPEPLTIMRAYDFMTPELLALLEAAYAFVGAEESALLSDVIAALPKSLEGAVARGTISAEDAEGLSSLSAYSTLIAERSDLERLTKILKDASDREAYLKALYAFVGAADNVPLEQVYAQAPLTLISAQLMGVAAEDIWKLQDAFSKELSELSDIKGLTKLLEDAAYKIKTYNSTIAWDDDQYKNTATFTPNCETNPNSPFC